MDDIIVPELQNVDTTLIIDPDTRTIDAGSDFLLGVETDNDAERVKFQCPKIVGDNLDLSQYHIYIHYQNAKGEKGKYLCEDIEDSGENITFSWLLSQKAVLYKGQTKFLVCAKKTQEDTIVWNTTLANGNVLEGLDVDEDIVQQNDDVIEQILLKLEQIEASGGSYTLPIATPTQLGGVKPVAKTDEMTQEVGVDEAGGLFTKEGDGIDEETLNQINKNTEDISKLSDSKANITYVDGQIAKAQLEGAGVDTSQFLTKSDISSLNTGLSNDEKTLILTLFQNAVYSSNQSGNIQALYNLFFNTVISVTGISLSISTLFIDSADSQTLVATLIPSGATGTVEWSSSNDSVATISKIGVVTPISNGTCIITATCEEYSASCEVSVDLSNVVDITQEGSTLMINKALKVTQENSTLIIE